MPRPRSRVLTAETPVRVPIGRALAVTATIAAALVGGAFSAGLYLARLDARVSRIEDAVHRLEARPAEAAAPRARDTYAIGGAP